jgi:hypothetical protein
MQLEIHPLEGINGLKFGAKKSEIISLLGLPDTDEPVESVISEENIEYLEYEELGLICYIKGYSELQLNDIEITNKNALLFHQPIFQLSSNEAIELMAKHDFPLLEKEIEGDVTIISFYNCFFDFIYKKEQLKCIEISDFAQKFE